jgi:hypothetical protein
MPDEPSPEVGLAFLELPRQTCVGCSDYLYARGMLEIVAEAPLIPSARCGAGAVVARTYRMAPGVTLADCQAAVKARHKGPRPWGLE